ncbi:MAG: PD-(D/E)XK nuclease domain-containing protein, partial [Polyangiaceae bacterium]|nr:PD-(D/E)XK nuclease domain-containing protein [Polyangiaceae bacterium]
DTVIETDNYVYCFEYKLDQPPKVALAQINRKEYALQWSAGNRTVFKVGVELSSKTRTVAGYEVEVVEGAG